MKTMFPYDFDMDWTDEDNIKKIKKLKSDFKIVTGASLFINTLIAAGGGSFLAKKKRHILVQKKNE